ncbi:MAG: transposase [Deltaproteobacteria bacterium]|nr:transposase [Deltaproteobacteria bacterium]
MKQARTRCCSRKASSLDVLPTTRKSYRSDVSDVQWDYLCGLLPKGARTGRPRANEREILNGILYVLKTGCQWEDLPHDIAASPKTCHRRLLDYHRRRVWQKIVRALLQEADRRGYLNFTNAYHDASVIKSKKGPPRKSATPAITIFAGSNATSSSKRMGIRSTSPSPKPIGTTNAPS